MRQGLVIGKFYPPHKGHKFLIEAALRNSDRVDVMVCVRPEQTISGALRASWLREMVPAANVIEIEDLCDDDNSSRWAEYVKTLLGRAPDVVFTSEEYGERFSRFLGCEHVMVDATRSEVPVSGTMIRNSPLTCWEYLDSCVRAYYVVRICVVGAESTGTTTIARALADYFRTVWVEEYGREYAEEKLSKLDVNSIPTYNWSTEEFEHIARAQLEREDQLARTANRLLICDTDALATSVWHERYLGFKNSAIEQLRKSRRYDLYLLTDCDIPFVQDGTRDGEEIRVWMTGRFEEKLNESGRKWIKLSGSHENRMRLAIAAIEELLASK